MNINSNNCAQLCMIQAVITPIFLLLTFWCHFDCLQGSLALTGRTSSGK